MLCLVGQKRGLERENPHLEMGCVCFGKEIAGETAPCWGRERGERVGWREHVEGVWGIGVVQSWVALCLQNQVAKAVHGLGGEPQGPWKEPKRAEKPSEKQPTGLQPGALPAPMARPLPASLRAGAAAWCGGPRSCSSSRHPQPPEQLRFFAAHVCTCKFALRHSQAPSFSRLFCRPKSFGG